jgi:hypothetical protein
LRDPTIPFHAGKHHARERERERERGLDTKKRGNTQIPLSFPPEKRPWKKKKKTHQSILQLRRIADEGGRSRDPNSQRRGY